MFRLRGPLSGVLSLARCGVFVLLLATAGDLTSWTSTLASAADAIPGAAAGYVVNGTGDSNVEQAHAFLQGEGNSVYLIIVSDESTGVEGQIYRDLVKRHFRATTGPDEGIDTHAEVCYPDCVFVTRQEVNAIGVSAWIEVLRHEYRHITQALNNPLMAQDFRDPDGLFTPYAAFSEACADYGLNVAPVYEAQARIDRLIEVLQADEQGLIDQACQGDKASYQSLVEDYDQNMGDVGAFRKLFPPYR